MKVIQGTRPVFKYIGAAIALMIIGIFVAVFFINIDPDDSPLLAAWAMGLIGLAAGGWAGKR